MAINRKFEIRSCNRVPDAVPRGPGTRYPGSRIRYPASGIEHYESSIGQLVSSIKYKASRIQDPGSSIEYRASSIRHPASSTRHPASGLRRQANSAPGFTLMEILLAFLILGIVMTTILASFNAVFSTTDSLEDSARYYDMAKNCLNRMALDLGALYVAQPPIYKAPDFDDPPDPYRIVGASSDVGGTSFANIRFASSAHIPFNRSMKRGVAEIVYYVQGDSDGQRVLRRRDHLYPYPPFEENNGDPVLSEHVKSLAFRYFDDEGT